MLRCRYLSSGFAVLCDKISWWKSNFTAASWLIVPSFICKLRNLKRILLTGFFISLFIELTQLSISMYLGNSNRSFDVVDLILNTSGTALGYGLFCILPSLYKKIRFFYKH
ncbi:VanZ family protein [Bacillus sp. FSL K6-1003]|uniref:VanZ family protein n=1 Tax=Bacillus sp. FSL K6-1003 TaxID=2954675 RepID=UPI0030D2B42F